MASREMVFRKNLRVDMVPLPGGRREAAGWFPASAGFGEAAGMGFRVQLNGDRPAILFRSGKIPAVGKIPALLGFDRLDGAIVAVQKNAFVVGLVLQGQAGAIASQPRESLNEFILAQALESGQPRDFTFLQPDLSRPAAAGRATLAFQKNRHAPP